MAEGTKSKNRNLSIVLPTVELKAKFLEDAERAGHSPSEHGALLIANHLEGKSLDQVHEEMAEVTSELGRFRHSFEQHRRAVYFSLIAVITNMPNGAEAAKAFEARYLEEMTKGG